MYRRELIVRGDSEPYNGLCGGPCCLSVVDDLAALRREVLRIVAVAPIHGHDYLPLGHHALVVCGKAGVGAEQGAAACHVGPLEGLSDLKLYTLVNPVDLSKSADMIFRLDAGEPPRPLFPQPVKRCRICNIPVGGKPHWSFEEAGESAQTCVPCYERIQDLVRSLVDRKWSFHE
jgi:hypothetical protein